MHHLAREPQTSTTKAFLAGFTLIELLVVIAIIGMLSSVVLASLNSARNKGKDAAIKAQLVQLRSLYELEYNDKGSYAALKAETPNGWFSTAAECASASYITNTSSYAAEARSICRSIVTSTGSSCAGNITCLYLGYESSGSPNKYSVMAWLPGAQKWFCVGSSGRSGLSNGDPWAEPGCTINP